MGAALVVIGLMVFVQGLEMGRFDSPFAPGGSGYESDLRSRNEGRAKRLQLERFS